jgi:NhaP-type Na+/H+ or K+/H+ antiporter
MQEAATSFFLVIVVGTLIGLLVGAIFYGIHKWLPTTPGIAIVLTFLAPYCMYFAAEHFHFSGVLAVVAGGLFLSSKRQKILNYRSRIAGVNVWNSIVFVLNGLIFLLIGLQLPTITQQMGDISLGTAIWYGLAVSFALIATRLLTTFGAGIFTRVASHFITVVDPNPEWKFTLIAGWAGMRGVVSLAAALSIPLLINHSQPFPFRNLILFITFIVILVTLVFQGITLPFLIKKLKIEDKYATIPEHEQELIIQKKISQYSLQYLEENQGQELPENEFLNNLKGRLSVDIDLFNQDQENTSSQRAATLKQYQQVYLKLLDYQRTLLQKMNRRSEFDEELIRKYQALIDLEELKVREKY